MESDIKMNKILNFIKSKSNIIIAVGVIICAIILVVPILQIAKYNMPSADDYSYGYETHLAWENTHNIFNVLKASFKTVAQTYNGWQGTFSAIFMFALQPSIFGNVQFYSITTFILIFTLLISNICLIKTIAKKLFNYNKNSVVFIISILITVFAIEMLPEPVQSLFWWNGSIYYTFFYSIMLLAISAIINLITSKTQKGGVILWTILCVLLSVVVSGSNFPTALSYTIILVLITLSLFIIKNKKKYHLSAITVVTIVSFLISVLAPGNAVRQSMNDNSLGAVKSILAALVEGTKLIYNWTNLIVVIGFLILIPFIYQVIKESKFKFKYPLIFTIISFGIFCSQLVPPLYALNDIGAGRLIDMVYYSYYWLLLLNFGYYLGWITKKFGEEFNNLMEYINERIIIYVSILFVVLILVCFPTKKYKEFTSYEALNSLVTGEAANYHEEMLERYKILENEDIKEVYLKELTNHPYLLFFNDFNEDKDFWINSDAARYFNKNFIIIEK